MKNKKLTMKQLIDKREKYDVYQQIADYEEFRLEFMPILKTFEAMVSNYVKETFDFNMYSNDMTTTYEVLVGPIDVSILVRNRYRYFGNSDSFVILSFNNKEKTCLKEFNKPTIDIAILRRVLKEMFLRYDSDLESKTKWIKDIMKALNFTGLDSGTIKAHKATLEKNKILSQALRESKDYGELYYNLLTKIDEMFGEGVGKAIEDGKFVAVSVQEYNGLRKE